jgi:hypothetical protein
MEKALSVCDICEHPATQDNELVWEVCGHVFCDNHCLKSKEKCPVCEKTKVLGTTGNVEWSVRAEYKMLNESGNKDKPESFILFYTVYTDGTQKAWDLASSAFPMKFVFNGKIYGRTEMRVEID